MKRQFTAVFEDGGDGWVTAYVEEVPGAVTQGRTIEEARESLKEALALVLDTQREIASSERASELARETIIVDIPG